MSDNPHLRQLTNPLMGILHPWKHFIVQYVVFMCRQSLWQRDCCLLSIGWTTGWLKLLSRFILIHKSPLVSRVALTLALEVLESMMKTWVLDFVQKVFFSMSFSICHWTWEKVALLNCFFNFMHPWDCMNLVCVHYWTFYVEDAWITLSLRNIRLGHVRHG